MWINFEQSPLEDETISNSFSSRGIYRISSSEEVLHYPNVRANVQNQKMVLTIDNTLLLLEDEMVGKCHVLTFDSNIDCLSISPTGNIIICCLSNGEIHGISIRGFLLFNISVEREDINITSCRTFAVNQYQDNRYFFVCINGSIYRLSEIDENILERNLQDTNHDSQIEGVSINIFNDIELVRLYTIRGVKEITAALLLPSLEPNDMPILIAGVHNTLIQRVDHESDFIRLSIPDSYKGIKQFYNLNTDIIILTNSGHLMNYCPFTNILMLISSEKSEVTIKEIILMDSNDDQIEFLALTKGADALTGHGDSENFIKILEYPSMKCLNTLEVGTHAWLVQQSKSSLNLFYISGRECNHRGFPSILELMLVSETHPSERFKKLISKGYLDEAEDFGKQFELCLQPIYEARAKRLLMEMDSSNDNLPNVEQNFSKLMALFQKIKNKEFFRVNRIFNTSFRKILEKYLKEILKHLNDEMDKDYTLEIIEQLDRLKTLAIIDPYEINTDWLKFVQHPNLIKYVSTLLQTDMSLACLIWKRHSAFILPRLQEHELCKLLTIIPNDTKPFNLLLWLRQFVPIIGNTHPNVIVYITEWSMQKTRSLQYTEHWPEIGLEFATKSVEIFEEVQFMHSDVRRQYERNLMKLRELVNALQDLYVLKKSYNLILTLDNYLQESIDETSKFILLRVHLDNLKSLVNDFLYPIYQEKGKTPVAAIKRYISLLVASRSSFTTWLERSMACIDLLHIEDDRLEMALLVLQNASVPWPDTVAPLLKLRYSTHPLALKIRTEFDIQVIKIMKVKYGWPMDTAADANLHLFMLRIVKMDLKDMLDDIRTLTEAAPEIAIAANFNCCYQLVRRGKFQVAYNYLNSLKADKTTKSSCADQIVELFAQHLEHNLVKSCDPNLLVMERDMLDFFKLISPQTCPIAQKRLKMIQNRFKLYEKFEIDSILYINDLIPFNNRLIYLDKGIETLIKRSREQVDICKYFYSEVGELCATLEFPRIMGLKCLSARLNCLTLTCTMAYYMLTTEECRVDTKNDYVDFALQLIVQQIQIIRMSSKSSLSVLLYDNDPLAFPLAYELLARASLYEYEQLVEINELLHYIRVAKDCYCPEAMENLYEKRARELQNIIHKELETTVKLEDNTLNNSHLRHNSLDGRIETKSKKRDSVSIFDEIDVSTPIQKNQMLNGDYFHVVKFVSSTLLFLIMKTPRTNCILTKLKNLIDCDKQFPINIDMVYEEFFKSLEHLIKTKKHSEWYIIVQYLLHHQEEYKCRLINSDFVSLQLSRLLRNAMNNKHVNFLDLFVILTSDPHSATVLEKLNQEIKNDQQKINLLTLAEMYNMHYEELGNVQTIRNIRIKHYYYVEFCKQNPTIRGKFNADLDSIELLLKEFHNKQLDVHLLERMSRDFNLDYQKLLVTQVISILQSQEMQYECKNDIFGGEELVMSTSVEQIRQLCQPYINEIKNTDLLIVKLKHFLEEIHLYFYELYLCVIDILMYFDAAPEEMQIWSSILHFLKHKMIIRRRSRPGQLETDVWFESQKEIGVLPKIARFRLPFKPIVEHPLKDILDTELSVDTCESWFPLIQMHTMLKGSKDIEHNCDYFCMSAVKNSITEYKSKDETETWLLQPINNAFLKSILRLVEHVYNPSKAFMILYFVSNYAPEGADQVEASYECYKYALSHEINDPKCQEQLSKIKRKYPILKTQHLLYVYGLNDERLMRLIENPTELIYYLYHHEIILKGSKLDINAVVKEIAELHNIDPEPIQFKLLQKWLLFTSSTTDQTVLDDTLIEDQYSAESSQPEDISTATEDVIRANYIISSWPKDIATQFLIAHIFPPNELSGVNIVTQLRMYECSFKLYDGPSNFNTILNQNQYITIKCVHDLKKLGYNSSLKKFAESNKIDVLKTIWQRNAHNHHTLQLMANICLGFDIFVDKIWNGILKRMVMFNMILDLNALVDVLSCKPQLLHIEGLIMAWECVLFQPFKNANQSRSFQQEDLLQRTLVRLQSCPIVHSLNLLKFTENCLRLKRPHMAAIFLIFCRTDEQRQQLKLLIRQRSNKLREDIMELEDYGILPFIINFVLKELGF